MSQHLRYETSVSKTKAPLWEQYVISIFTRRLRLSRCNSTLSFKKFFKLEDRHIKCRDTTMPMQATKVITKGLSYIAQLMNEHLVEANV